MSRTETALKPLVANNSSAAHKIASRRFGLRVAAFLLADFWIMICTIVQKIRSGQQYPWALVLMLETLAARVRWQSCPAKTRSRQRAATQQDQEERTDMVGV